MPTEPFSVNLAASNQSLIRGCPGVPKTCPRIDSMLEIRSKDGIPFMINKVILELNTLQSVSIPQTVTNTDLSEKFTIYKKVIFNREDSKQLMKDSPGRDRSTYSIEENEKTLGFDLPFIIPIPNDIISTGQNSRWNSKTTHELNIKIGWYYRFQPSNSANNINLNVADSHALFKEDLDKNFRIEPYQISFPIVIKRYDTLPLYQQYNEPITKTIDSVDTVVEYSIPTSSVGPNDEVLVYLKILPNKDYLSKNINHDSFKLKKSGLIKKKINTFKLKKIYFELREILTYKNKNVLHSKQTKLLSKQQEFDTVLDDEITTQISFDFPSELSSILDNSTYNPVNNNKLSITPRISIPEGNNQLTKKFANGFKRKTWDFSTSSSTTSLQSMNYSMSSAGGPSTARNSIDGVRGTPLISTNYDNSTTPLNNNHQVEHSISRVSTTPLNFKTIATNTKILDKINNEIPLPLMQGFTTQGKLFSIKYELVFKIKIINSSFNHNSIKFSQPLTVSPFDRVTSRNLLKWIVQEYENVKLINSSYKQGKISINKINLSYDSDSDSSDTSKSEIGIYNCSHNSSQTQQKISNTVENRFFHPKLPVKSATFDNSYNSLVLGNRIHNASNYCYDNNVDILRNVSNGSLKDGLCLYDFDDDDTLDNIKDSPVYKPGREIHIYRAQNEMDWKLLGLSEQILSGENKKLLVHYLD